MSNSFVFTSALGNDFLTGEYCVFPVSSEPQITDSIVSNVSSVPNFTPIILNNKRLLNTGWVVDDFLYPFFNYTVDTVGFCVARLVQSTPSPNDKLISYHGYVNNLNQNIITPPGGFANAFAVDDTFGLIKRKDAWIYTSGELQTPSTAIPPNGLVYLAGVRNNPNNTFGNPVDNIRASAWGATNGADYKNFYDRTGGNDVSPDHILDMRNGKIRLGDVHMLCGSGTLNNVTWWGSNSIDIAELNAGNTSAIYNDNSRWTQLTNSVNLPTNSWVKVSSTNNQTFWRHLKINSSNGANTLDFIEFGRSSWLSAKENLEP